VQLESEGWAVKCLEMRELRRFYMYTQIYSWRILHTGIAAGFDYFINQLFEANN